MNQGDLSKIVTKTAAEVCQRFELGDEAKALLKDDLAPGRSWTS